MLTIVNIDLLKCLIFYQVSTYVGVKSTVAGWGRQGQDKNPSDVLLMANVFVMRDEGCKQTAIGEHLTNEMLCAYNTNVDACQVRFLVVFYILQQFIL